MKTMDFSKFSNKYSQRGEVSKLLLILAVIVLVVAIVAYLIIAANSKPKAKEEAENSENNQQTEVPAPVYEKQLGEIKFTFQVARDMGPTLDKFNLVNQSYANQTFSPKSIKTTTGRFIRVTVGAVNTGKFDTGGGIWDILNLVDSEGRNFVPSKSYQFAPWLPEGGACGASLKPSFDPVSCSKMYEVSNESVGLKVVIFNKKAASTKTDGPKITADLIDINLE